MFVFSFFQPAVISQSTDTGDLISADPDSILDIKKRLERIKNNSRNWQTLSWCSSQVTGEKKTAVKYGKKTERKIQKQRLERKVTKKNGMPIPLLQRSTCYVQNASLCCEERWTLAMKFSINFLFLFCCQSRLRYIRFHNGQSPVFATKLDSSYEGFC